MYEGFPKEEVDNSKKKPKKARGEWRARRGIPGGKLEWMERIVLLAERIEGASVS